MKTPIYPIVLLASVLLLGCSPDNNTKTKLFEEQRTALEKAKAVESTVQQQARETQSNLEKQTQ